MGIINIKIVRIVGFMAKIYDGRHPHSVDVLQEIALGRRGSITVNLMLLDAISKFAQTHERYTSIQTQNDCHIALA